MCVFLIHVTKTSPKFQTPESRHQGASNPWKLRRGFFQRLETAQKKKH